MGSFANAGHRAALAALLLAGGASADAGRSVDASRIVPHPRLGRLVVKADLTGDGKPEQVRVVRVLPRPAKGGGAQVRLANPWNPEDEPMGKGGAAMALSIADSRPGAPVWLLHSDYIRLSAEVMEGAPVRAAAHRSRTVRDFRRDCPAIRGDVLVMATPAGIDIAVYWARDHYAVCWPNEEP